MIWTRREPERDPDDAEAEDDDGDDDGAGSLDTVDWTRGNEEL